MRLSGRFAWIVGVCLLASLGGCTEFRPERPMRSRSFDVELDLDKVRLGRVDEFVLNSRTTVPHTLVQAWYTVPERIPCTGGQSAAGIRLDGNLDSVDRLPTGSHQLRVAFGQNTVAFEKDGVLDLELDGGTCVRTPVVSQVIAFTPLDRPWRLILSNTLNGASGLYGLDAIYGVSAGIGRWMGPFLVSAQAGAGIALCGTGTCGTTSSGGSSTYPIDLDVRYAFRAARMGIMAFAPQIGVHYGYAPIALDALDGKHTFGAHYFQAVLAMDMADARRGPFYRLERNARYDFALPIGIVATPDSPTRSVAFAIGMVIRYVLPL